MENITDYLINMGLELLENKKDSWNARCPICGDSKKSKTKKRFWIFWSNEKSVWLCYCYNCFLNTTFFNLLNKYYPILFEDYKANYIKKKIEERKNRYDSIFTKTSKSEKNGLSKKNNIGIDNNTKQDNLLRIKSIRNSISNKLSSNTIQYLQSLSKDKLEIISINDLNKSHKAYKYLLNRKIPDKYFSEFLYTSNFINLCNSLHPGKYQFTCQSDERIIIPFFKRSNKLFMFQGRGLKNQKVKYLTFKLDNKYPKIYGLPEVNINKDIFIFEGPIDSLFLKNSIAMAGGDVSKKILEKITDSKKFIFVYDIDPRNINIVKKIESRIKEGFKVCLFPLKYLEYGKDVNELIMNKISSDYIEKIIYNNTFEGTKALLELYRWRKING